MGFSSKRSSTGNSKPFHGMEWVLQSNQYSNKNTESLVTDSTIAFTDNADISLNGGCYVFAPAADVEITPVWNGTVPVGSELKGWNSVDNGTETAVAFADLTQFIKG